VAVYNVNENLTPVLLTTMTTCFYVPFAVLGLEKTGLGLDLGTAGLGLEGAGLGLITAGLHYNTGINHHHHHRHF